MGSRCWVFVLGDFGRSPRMQYHTESLLKKGVDVTVIAFPGSTPLESITANQKFTFEPVPTSPAWLEMMPGVVYLFGKALFQFLCLMVMFVRLPHPDFVLVQIPPAIPTLFLCAGLQILRRTRIVLDWHNFAFTLMQLNPQTPRFLVSIAKLVERYCGRFANGHLCVSRAMKQKLKEWNMDALVVYDRPHGRYRQSSIQQTHALMHKLRSELASALHPNDLCAQAYLEMPEEETIVTEWINGVPQLKASRPAVLVSSTSWTPDENFSILLKAVEMYDQRRQKLSPAEQMQWPSLLIFITGKGPLRDHYVQKMHKMDLQSVALMTVWLEAGDYPILLGCADIGISLHTSSSGVDLPMKVVDMFGCALPVCSASYPAISELVRHNFNGLLFQSPDELCASLWELLKGFPFPSESQSPVSLLSRLRQNLLQEESLSWDANWEQTVWPMINC